MSSPKFGFYFNLVFALINLGLFFFTPFDWASPFSLVVGCMNAYFAYRLRSYA